VCGPGVRGGHHGMIVLVSRDSGTSS
jgi:hypothetical protein